MVHLLKELDIKIFFLINQTFSNPVFDSIMPLITNKNNWILIIIILLFYLAIYNGKRGQIAFVILILAVGFTDSFSSFILKPYFERIRPSHETYEHINLLIARGGKWSMPSNHAANISAIAVILSYFYDKWKIPLYSLAFIIAFSRVYVGVHYPADVLVGGLIGYGMAWLILTLWVILKMRELKRGQTWVWYEGDFQNQ